MWYNRNYKKPIYKISLLKSKPESDQASSLEIGYEEHIKWHGGIITEINKVENHIDDPVSLIINKRKSDKGRGEGKLIYKET